MMDMLSNKEKRTGLSGSLVDRSRNGLQKDIEAFQCKITLMQYVLSRLKCEILSITSHTKYIYISSFIEPTYCYFANLTFHAAHIKSVRSYIVINYFQHPTL